MDEVRKNTQKIVDNILSAINPVSYSDLPFAVFSLRKILIGLEKQMDDKQRLVGKSMRNIFESNMQSTDVNTFKWPNN